MASEIKVDTIVNAGGDNDSGIDLSTNDQVKVKIAGSTDLTFKANEIENSSGDLTIDVAGNIILDADGTDIILKDGGTTYGQFFKDGNNFKIVAGIQDGDIVFRGNDGGSGIDAMTIDMSTGGKVGIGTTSPAELLHLDSGGSTTTIQIDSDTESSITFNDHGGSAKQYKIGTNITDNNSQFEIRDVTAGVIRIRLKSDGDVEMSSSNLSIGGAISKGSGSFKIDHPLDSKKDTHHLVHSFIEGPQADLIYRGTATLSSGSATVNIDTVSGMTSGTFVALNTNVQCFTNNETGWTAVKSSISGNTLTITAQDNSCTDTISWMVIGERDDVHMKDTNWTDENGRVIVELEKEDG